MTARPLHLTIYRATKLDPNHVGIIDDQSPRVPDGWRWTLKAGNGVIVDASTEAYTRRAGLDANLLQAHGLDVAGIKPGETVEVQRIIRSGHRLAWVETIQTIKVTVTP